MESRMAEARLSNSRLTPSSCSSIASTKGWSLTCLQPYSLSTLLRAMTKGVCLARSMFIDSMVCGSSPCMMSITRMAMSQSEEPRERRLEKDSCPGVSMMSRPGTRTATLFFASSEPIRSQSVSFGKKEAPICCVMPPASPSCTFVRRMLSSSFVFPVSTCPMMQQMGERSRSGVRAAIAALVRTSRSSLAAALPASSSSSEDSSPDSDSSSSSSSSSGSSSSSSSGSSSSSSAKKDPPKKRARHDSD
mmetsp:Transcript_10865/g.34460  ORF Transcript_10865/g.34460 Transcript_10865/m.34460 type:complete len:248 (-) Transcript_10865:301-1044(-)